MDPTALALSIIASSAFATILTQFTKQFIPSTYTGAWAALVSILVGLGASLITWWAGGTWTWAAFGADALATLGGAQAIYAGVWAITTSSASIAAAHTAAQAKRIEATLAAHSPNSVSI